MIIIWTSCDHHKAGFLCSEAVLGLMDVEGAGVSDGLVYRRGRWLPGTGRVSSLRHRARKAPLQLPGMVRFSSFENLLCQVEFFKWQPVALPS